MYETTKMIEVLVETMAVLVGIFVIVSVYAASLRPLGRRFRRFHTSFILSLVLYVLSMILRIVGILIGNDYIGIVLHHIFMVLIVVAFLFTVRFYRMEVEADEKLRGITDSSQ